MWGLENFGDGRKITMKYSTPELRFLGSLAGLTLGNNGSCLDGASRNNIQLGGGFEDGGGDNKDGNCGPSD
jgi:hypothetical protein